MYLLLWKNPISGSIVDVYVVFCRGGRPYTLLVWAKLIHPCKTLAYREYYKLFFFAKALHTETWVSMAHLSEQIAVRLNGVPEGDSLEPVLAEPVLAALLCCSMSSQPSRSHTHPPI